MESGAVAEGRNAHSKSSLTGRSVPARGRSLRCSVEGAGFKLVQVMISK